VVAADQLSKHVLQGALRIGEERKLLPGLAVVDTRNSGVAFSLHPGGGAVLGIVVAVALLALLVYFARHRQRPWIWLPTGLLVGGALGNVIDRVRQGSVTDFIKLPLGWPPFNLADASITVGVAVLIALVWAHDRSAATADD
jgi:signal peptidase II